MSAKIEDQLEEYREIHAKMEELNKKVSSAENTLVKKQRALEKAQQRVDEALEELKTAEKERNEYAPEQRKANTKLMSILVKDPAVSHEILGKFLALAPESDDEKETQKKSQASDENKEAATPSESKEEFSSDAQQSMDIISN